MDFTAELQRFVEAHPRVDLGRTSAAKVAVESIHNISEVRTTMLGDVAFERWERSRSGVRVVKEWEKTKTVRKNGEKDTGESSPSPSLHVS